MTLRKATKRRNSLSSMLLPLEGVLSFVKRLSIAQYSKGGHDDGISTNRMYRVG